MQKEKICIAQFSPNEMFRGGGAFGLVGDEEVFDNLPLSAASASLRRSLLTAERGPGNDRLKRC